MIKAPKGTVDVLPSEVYKWHYVEKLFEETCKEFGYEEIRTPVFEHTELFKRGVGETTDVVNKEMYTFLDKGERSITLKPEGTAPVVRAFIERKLYSDAQPTKVFYNTPCFRYERPQKGRQRQFNQFGIEVFGSYNPSIDAEVMSLVNTFYKKLNVTSIQLRINSVGCPKCRAEYNEKLRSYLKDKLNNLCETCNDRYDRNPMRIIDCKNPKCQEEIVDVPLMLDNLCEECNDHFEKVKTYLNVADVKFEIDPKIVRGLDYYNRTAFEFISEEIGSQSTVCGGGRYDNLVEQIDGPKTPGVGFGMGIERLLLTLENNNIEIPKPEGLDIFIATMGEKAEIKSFKVLTDLREAGIIADKDHIDRSLKAQFKYANKKQAKYTIVLGDNEIENNVATLKNMESGEQTEINLDELKELLKEKLNK